MAYDFDLFTIGGGSGGVRASRFAAGYGAKVAIAEERWLGGTCVNVGCVPKKLFSYAAHFREEFEDAAGFGWSVGERTFDWATLVANKDKEISRLNGIYEQILGRAGVEILHGRATILDPHTVEVKGRKITARHILVATGGRPSRDSRPGVPEHGLVSDDFFHLPDLPRRVLVAGGGYIAVEFAGIFRGLGAEVTQMYRGPLFLRGFDDDVRVFLRDEMQKKGVRLVFDCIVERIEKTAGGYACHLSNGMIEEYDAVVYAIGREPNVEGLGLEGAGVELKGNGAVVVDDYFQSSVPSIHALGDVTDRINLTPVALAEGMALAKTLFTGERTRVNYDYVPTAVFSHPPIGTVGLAEGPARQRYGAIDVYRSEFRPLKHTLSGSRERTLMKLIVERAGQRVVGCPHGRARRLGDPAGHRHRDEGGGDQAGVRRDHRDTSNRGGGVRHDARACPRADGTGCRVAAAEEGGMSEHDEENFQINRARWDEVVDLHVASPFYRVKEFLAGEDSRLPIEREELGPVAGKRLVHLQCHFGLDCLSMARLGAEVTGLDFSGKALAAARRIAGEAGIAARFVQGNVYDAQLLLERRYQIAYVTWGAINWLPDIAAWARTVAAVLEPGGFLYMIEGHPYALTLDQREITAPIVATYPYWHKPEPLVFNSDVSYTGEQTKLTHTEMREWIHPVADIVGALLDAGLRLEFLHEHPRLAWQLVPAMVEDEDRMGRPRRPQPHRPLAASPRSGEARTQARIDRRVDDGSGLNPRRVRWREDQESHGRRPCRRRHWSARLRHRWAPEGNALLHRQERALAQDEFIVRSATRVSRAAKRGKLVRRGRYSGSRRQGAEPVIQVLKDYAPERGSLVATRDG